MEHTERTLERTRTPFSFDVRSITSRSLASGKSFASGARSMTSRSLTKSTLGYRDSDDEDLPHPQRSITARSLTAATLGGRDCEESGSRPEASQSRKLLAQMDQKLDRMMDVDTKVDEMTLLVVGCLQSIDALKKIFEAAPATLAPAIPLQTSLGAGRGRAPLDHLSDSAVGQEQGKQSQECTATQTYSFRPGNRPRDAAFRGVSAAPRSSHCGLEAVASARGASPPPLVISSSIHDATLPDDFFSEISKETEFERQVTPTSNKSNNSPPGQAKRDSLKLKAEKKLRTSQRSTASVGSRHSGTQSSFGSFMETMGRHTSRGQSLGTHYYSLYLKIGLFLEDPSSGMFARWYANAMACFLSFSVCLTLWRSEAVVPLSTESSIALEAIFEATFLLELLLRYTVSLNRDGFMRNTFNIVDFISTIPLVPRLLILFDLAGSGFKDGFDIIIFVTLPIVRLLKTLRYFQEFRLLVSAFKMAAEALPVLLFAMLIAIIAFSTLLYTFEPRDNFEDFNICIWFVVVTMTTVGYGDITPTTPLGKGLTLVLIFVGVLYMAVPIGIVGAAFSTVWSDRDSILLRLKVRDRLRQQGFSGKDALTIFRHFDDDGNGQLTLSEFSKMIKTYKLGLSKERVMKLFNSFDVSDGCINDKNFVQHLFPDQYGVIFDAKTLMKRSDTVQSVKSGGSLYRIPKLGSIVANATANIRRQLTVGSSKSNIATTSQSVEDIPPSFDLIPKTVRNSLTGMPSHPDQEDVPKTDVDSYPLEFPQFARVEADPSPEVVSPTSSNY